MRFALGIGKFDLFARAVDTSLYRRQEVHPSTFDSADTIAQYLLAGFEAVKTIQMRIISIGLIVIALMRANLRIDLVRSILANHMKHSLITTGMKWHPRIHLNNLVVEDGDMLSLSN